MKARIEAGPSEMRNSRGLARAGSCVSLCEKHRAGLRIPDCERYIPGDLCLNLGPGELAGKCLRENCPYFSGWKVEIRSGF